MKERRLKFPQESVTALLKMVNNEEARAKQTNIQINILKSAVRNKTGTKIQDEESPHELFLRARQISKIRNAFTNNMSTGIKVSKA